MVSDQDDLKKDGSGQDGPPQRPAQPQSFYERKAKAVVEIAGDLGNQLVGAALHTDLAQKFSEPINTALARQYIRGRTILEQRQAQGKSLDDLSSLSTDEVTAVRAYQKVHNDLPASIPFVDRDALVRQVERNIELKARVVKAPAQDNSQLSLDKKASATEEAAPGDRPAKGPIQPLVKEAGVKAPSLLTAKETQQKAPGVVTPKDAQIKTPGLSVPKETAIRTAASPKPGESPSKGVPTGEATASERSNRSAKTTSDIHNAQGQSVRGTEQAFAKSPPRPHEPEARALKNPDIAGSADGRTVQRVVPQPHPPASGNAREAHTGSGHSINENLDGAKVVATQHPPLKFAGVLGQEKSPAQRLQLGVETFVSKVTSKSTRSVSFTDNRQGTTMPSCDKPPVTVIDKRPGVAARLIDVIEGKLRPATKDVDAPRNWQLDKTGRTIRAEDSRVLQLIREMQAFPFGRQFGRVEKVGSLLPPQSMSGRRPVEQSSKTFEIAKELKAHASLAHILIAKNASSAPGGQRPEPKHSNGETNIIGKLHTGTEAHGASATHGTSETHGTSKAQSGSGRHAAGVTHGAGETQGTSEVHNASEIHGAGEIHATSEIHITGEGPSTNSPRHITVIDTKGAEVSPFGKDQDDNKESEDLNGNVVKTYVVKGLMPDKRYITGTELAFVAIMALASASRVRPGENAVEQGLVKARREFVLVEEEPWVNPDYSPPLNKATAASGTQAESMNSDSKVSQTKDTHSQEKSLSAAAQKTNTQHKILLRPQIMVQEGDNLCDMAEALFNDSRYGHLIADLNAKTIDESWVQGTRLVRLKTRQRISLPVYQDTVQFDARRLSEVGDLPLITVVESTAIDKELLSEGLSTMLGINSKNIDPLEKREIEQRVIGRHLAGTSAALSRVESKSL